MKGHRSFSNLGHGNPTAPPSTLSRPANPQQPLPLKRTRAKRSCDFCRKRKSRCDADTSIPCSNCKAWGFTCEFQTVRKKRGPPSVYVDNLEKRCKKMEKLLTALTKFSINDLERNDFRLPKSFSSHEPAIKDQAPDEDDYDYDGDNDDDEQDDSVCLDLESHMARLEIGDYDQVTYTGQSASIKILDPKIFDLKPFVQWPGRQDVALKLTSQNELVVLRSDKRVNIGISVRSSTITGVGQAQSPIAQAAHTLAPSSMTDKMIALYFSHIHLFLPIINKARFSASTSPTVLVHAVLALAFRFSRQYFPNLVEEDAGSYAHLYFEKTLKRLRHSFRSRVSHVQAAILLTLYLDMEDGDDAESLQWYTLGTAIRMAQDLGLHRSCAHWNIPASEKETRHRVFYACYILDRWLSARAGKPLAILDRDLDADLPSPYDVTDGQHLAASGLPVYRSFVLLVKLSEILGRVLKALYAPKSKHANDNAGLDESSIVHVLDRRLKIWKRSLDEPVDGVDVNPAQKAHLEVFYYTVIVLLHRPFIESSRTRNADGQPNATSRTVCTDAAAVISHIIRRQSQDTSDPDKYYSLCLPTCMTYAMFQSSLIHLANTVRNPSDKDTREALENSITLIKEYSHLASTHRALSILTMLQSIYGIHTPSEPVVPSTQKETANLLTEPTMVQKSAPWLDNPLPSTFPVFPHPPLTNSAANAATEVGTETSFDSLVGMPASMCYDPFWRDPHQLEDHHQLHSSIHHNPTTILGQLTEPPMELTSHDLYQAASQNQVGFDATGSKSSTSSVPFYHHHHTSSMSSTSSSSSFVSTPHPSALAPGNLSMGEWDIYLDQQPSQQPSQHHHFNLMPPHS